MGKGDKNVMVTGASGGVGQAVVQLFHEAGWYVIGVDRESFPASFPKNGLFIRADISQPDAFPGLFNQVNEFSSYLNVLINNASVQITKPLLAMPVEEWDEVMASNLRTVFLAAKYAHPYLKKSGDGAIVNVSSVHAIATSSNIAAYAASKGGMLALTRALAIEFAVDNIRVNAILPGAVDTQMLRAGLNREHGAGISPEDAIEALARKTVIGRVGTPQEIAKSIYFLSDSTQSSFMTGQALVVDGGATARLSTE